MPVLGLTLTPERSNARRRLRDGGYASTTLAVDAGKTNLRLALRRDPPGRPGAELLLPGVPNVREDQGTQTIAAAIAGGLRRLNAPADSVTTVVAGLTGIRTDEEPMRELARLLSESTQAGRVTVCSDVLCAYVGALGMRPGAVIAAGTGAVALGVAATGEWTMVDGWGYLLGDGGSAYALGRAGIGAALRAADGRGTHTALLPAVQQRYGGVEEAVARIYGCTNPAGMIADFAVDVLAVAAAGDHEALRLTAGVADDLTELAVASLAVCDAAEPLLSWHGGLIASDVGIRKAVLAGAESRVCGVRPQQPRGDGIAGAFMIDAHADHAFLAPLISSDLIEPFVKERQ